MPIIAWQTLVASRVVSRLRTVCRVIFRVMLSGHTDAGVVGNLLDVLSEGAEQIGRPQQ